MCKSIVKTFNQLFFLADRMVNPMSVEGLTSMCRKNVPLTAWCSCKPSECRVLRVQTFCNNPRVWQFLSFKKYSFGTKTFFRSKEGTDPTNGKCIRVGICILKWIVPILFQRSLNSFIDISRNWILECSYTTATEHVYMLFKNPWRHLCNCFCLLEGEPWHFMRVLSIC
jgi:hypothetical protein